MELERTGPLHDDEGEFERQVACEGRLRRAENGIRCSAGGWILEAVLILLGGTRISQMREWRM